MEHFDVMVIGTGAAGQTVAEGLASGGKSVCITDAREYGGTCALRGCEPKKVLFTATEVVERLRRQTGNGPEGSVGIDWPSLMEFKRSFTAPVPGNIEAWLSDSGVTLLHGTARFTAKNVVEVGGVPYSADTYVIATGAVPRPLDISGEEFVLDTEAFMAAERLGERVVFIGGGYVSFEFAHIASAAGAQVTILQREPRALEAFDGDLAGMLVDGYRDAGIDVFTDSTVTGISRVDGALMVACSDGRQVVADVAVHGAGRIPAIADLALDVAGVAYGRRGIEVDRTMRSTSNPRVYAVGDVAAAGAPLTPVASAQGRVVVEGILRPGSAEFASPLTPSVVFSSPVLASVGMTDEQAAAAGLDVEVKFTDAGSWAATRRLGGHVAGAKTIVERSSGRVLGAHLLGHAAADVINVFAVAIACGLTASELKRTIWAYPTGATEIPDFL